MTPLERIRLYNSPLLGLTELSLVLGMNRSTIHNRISRNKKHKDAPEVYTWLKLGPVWRKEDVETWLIMRAHFAGGPGHL